MSMDSRAAKRKKAISFLPICNKLPHTNDGERNVGVLTGNGVSVSDEKAMSIVYREGNFGKGTLSKSEPTFNSLKDDIPQILMQQQWENRMNLESKTCCKEDDGNRCSLSRKFGNPDMELAIKSVEKFLNSCYVSVPENSWSLWKGDNSRKHNVNDTCQSSCEKIRQTCNESQSTCGLLSETLNDISVDVPFSRLVEEILKTRKLRQPKESHRNKYRYIVMFEGTTDNSPDAKPQLRFTSASGEIKEVLKLNFCEAFFLCFALNSLKILNANGDEMEIADLWREFCKAEDNFVEKYIVYHHYRSFGWTVKSGLKFGGDYLLYKVGPAYYHANFLLWILDKRKKMTWNEFVALNRLVETFNKDLIFCKVFGSNVENKLCSLNSLPEFSILEIRSKRWIPSQERYTKKAFGSIKLIKK